MRLQVQSIVASLTAAVFAIVASVFLNGPPDYRHALLMAASAVTTATTACFVLGECRPSKRYRNDIETK